MATPPLMSERDEPYGVPGRWYDCTYASALMAAWKTGFRKYPLGYTAKEREALERSDDRPNETGGSVRDVDTGMQRRYGFHLEPVYPQSIVTALSGPKTNGFMVAGQMGLVPVYYRRFSPAFTGNHMVYVEPIGDKAHVRWMDPLATWGYLGDIVDIAMVAKFNAPFGSENMRRAREGTQGGYKLSIQKYATPRTWTVGAGVTLQAYDPNKPGGAVASVHFTGASSALADAEVYVSWPGDTTPPVPHGGPFLRVTNGVFKGLLIVKARVSVA